MPPPFLRPAEPYIAPPAPQPPLPLPPVPELPSRRPPDQSEEEIVFSRIVRATVGQIIEIPFWGTGWVYMGEIGSRRGIGYSSRRLDLEAGLTIGQTFVFVAEAPGTYILRFYRQDFIQDVLLNDFVQIIVGERREDTGSIGSITRDRITAEPRWPAESTLPTAPEPVVTGRAETPEERPSPAVAQVERSAPSVTPVEPVPPQTVNETAPLIMPPPVESLAEFVNRARQELDAGRIAQALTILDNMMLYHPHGNDEAFWLYGQLLESNSPSRDVGQALEHYRRLVRDFPQSSRVPEARRRIAYLERFFFNIR